MRSFLLLACLIQLPLALNVGYYSHDELQWLALADTDSITQLPWAHWLDFSVFQYRPFTFNFWLLLSHYFGYTPIAMHSVQALLGIANAALLRLCLIRFGAAPRHASAAALAFLLMPFVVFTHSWIGTFADQFCLGWLLLALLRIVPQPAAEKPDSNLLLTPLVVAALTMLALACKEAAVVFPCLLLAAAYRVRLRELLPSLIASGVIVVAYLLLRLDIILFAPRAPGVYTWAIGNIPLRLFEYSVFPFLPKVNDIIAFPWWDKTLFALAAIGTLIVLIAIASAGLRWLLALGLVWCAALGPVLILSTSSDLYAYNASAWACGVFALAWPCIKPWSKGLLVIACAVALVHSIELGRYMRRVGRLQQHLYASLLPLLPNASTSNPVRIRAAEAPDETILRHLTFAIPTYHHITFSPSIIVVASEENTSYTTNLMLKSGNMVPIENR